jgi:hypothetical protein
VSTVLACTLTKSLKVRRSNDVPTLYWWTLPAPLRWLASLDPGALAGARALVFPAAALGTAREGVRLVGAGVALVTDVAALLAARDDGAVAPCTIAIFPPTTTDADLERRAHEMSRGLERLPFTIALQPDGDGRARHHFCLRVPGKVLGVVEELALGRGFGGNAGQVEMALLTGLRLRPGRSIALELVMQDGRASLQATDPSGRRRITFLESGKGYTGVYENLAMADAVRLRAREAWRRFPVGVVMFVGLPLFIATFWMARLLGRSGAKAATAEVGGTTSA